jgi:hydrogenase maturation protease
MHLVLDAHAGSEIRVSDAPKPDTLVLGLGNPLRSDDGIGPAVIEWLQAHDLPSGAVVIDGGTRGLELILTLADCRRALIVDAAEIGRAPGEWERLTPDLIRPKDGPTISLHAAGLAEALALGEALGALPEEVVIFGVQPARLDWSPGLSAEAQAAVPEVGRAVLRETRSPNGENPDS